MKRRSQERGVGAFVCQELEARRLLAWGSIPELVGLSAAAADFPTITGAGTSIAVIDSGVDYNHPALGGGFGPGYKVIAGYDFVDNDSNPMDGLGHGTGVAGILAANTYTYQGSTYRGIAPGANIIALRVETAKGNDRSRVEAALQWVIDHRAQYNIVAVNMSIGDGEYSSPIGRAPYTDELAKLVSEGVFIAAASGNNGVQNPPAIEYPAADPSAYAIGSVNASDQLSTFTERSDQLDLLAPGEGVPVPYYDVSNGSAIYLAATGTSFSVPFAAGAAALLKQASPGITPAQIMQVLQSTGVSRYDSATGLTFSRINVDAALRAVVPLDDAYEPNNTPGTAQFLNLASGHTTLSNLRLVEGNDDYYRFVLSGTADVSVGLSYSGGGSLPNGQLLDSGGNAIATLSPGSSTRRLQAGTYYIHLVSGSTLPGVYAIDLSAAAVLPSNPGMRGTYNAIAFDGEGNLHAAWYDNAARTMDYAVRNIAGVWSTTQIIDSSLSSSDGVSLAIDAKGRPGITWYDPASQRLRYAHWNGSKFGVTFADRTKGVGMWSSLAYNGNTAVISYYDSSHGDLRMASFSKGHWHVRTLDSAGKTGLYTSIARNAVNHRFGIAYYDASEGVYQYAQQTTSGKWSIQTVDPLRTKLANISLTYDGSGNATFSYYTSKGLRYAQLAGNKWVRKTIATSGKLGRFSTVLFPKPSELVIDYYDPASKGISQAEPSGKSWSTQTLVSGGGAYLSAAAAEDGRQAIFYRASDGTLVARDV